MKRGTIKWLIPSLVAGLFLSLCLIGFAVEDHENVNLVLTYGSIDLPTYKSGKGCAWVRHTFTKKNISFFERNCPRHSSQDGSAYIEDREGRVVWVQPDSNRKLVTFTLMSKGESESPYDVIKNKWFDKLTSKQQRDCEITNADEPIKYFEKGENKGEPLNEDAPNPTAHKVRYKIDIKQEIVKEIMDKYGGLPDSQEYDYLCGPVVGSVFVSFAPYFEFDDRSPDKYLFVRSLGQEYGQWNIDLDSVTF